MKKSRLLLTAIPLMVFVSSMPSRGGEDRSPRLLTKETFMEMETVRSPVISPDGKQIIFTRGWINQLED
ncbi:PD40 domain-containing protein, partial [Candidatus Sumerlaeota bacterium]|nr:PD40 domain-containing protein [Candidatus Sumerlaeota bacterium]